MKQELNKDYEMYGHFSGFRKRLGTTPGHQFTEKELDDLVKKKKLENEPFYKSFDKAKIIEALNTIAYNSPNSKNNYAENGTELQKLDQLTNFTNYNTPQPSGWLNKYSS
jgi:hypothetical protein